MEEHSKSKIVFGFACASCRDDEGQYSSLYLNSNSLLKHSSTTHHFDRLGCQVKLIDPSQPARQANLSFICLDPRATEKNCGEEVPDHDNNGCVISESNTKFHLFKTQENIALSKVADSRSKDGKKHISIFCKEEKIAESLVPFDLSSLFGNFPYESTVRAYFTKVFNAFSASGPDIQSLICSYKSEFAVSPALLKDRLQFAVYFMFLLDTKQFLFTLPEWETLDSWACFIHFFLDEVPQGPVDSIDSPQLLLRKRVFYHMLHLEHSFSFSKLINLIATFKYFIFIARFIKFTDLPTEQRSEAMLQKIISAEPVFNFVKILKLWKSCAKRLSLLHGGAFLPQIFVFDNPNNPNQIVIGTCVYPSDLVGRMFQEGLQKFNLCFEKLCNLLPFPGSDLTLFDPCSRINSSCIIDDFSPVGPFYFCGDRNEINRTKHDSFVRLLFESCSGSVLASSAAQIESLIDELHVICLALFHISCGSPGRATDYSSLSFYGPARNLFFLQGHAFSVLRNSKIEKMTQRSASLIVRSFPKEVSDIFAKLLLVIRPIHVCVKLYLLANDSLLQEQFIENSVLHAFLNHGGEPFSNTNLLRYRLNKELASLAQKCVVVGDVNNVVMHIRIFRQLFAWTLNHRVVKGRLAILENSLQSEISNACGRFLSDLPLLHSLLIVNFVPEFARQGGRSEQAYYHNYGHNYLSIESNGCIVSSAMISEGFAISKLAHLTCLSFDHHNISTINPAPTFASRNIEFPPFDTTFQGFHFLKMEDYVDQRAFSISYYDNIVHRKNALVIAPTGSGKTLLTLKILLSAGGNKIFIVILPTNVTITQFIDRANTIRYGSVLRLGDFVQSLTSSAVNAHSLLDPSCVSSPFSILVCTPEALMQHAHFVKTRLLCFNLIETFIWDDCHEGGETNPFRPAFNCVSSMLSTAFDSKDQKKYLFPNMICISGSIPYSEQSSFLKNLFQPSFLKYHGGEEPAIMRSGKTIGKSHGWFLSLTPNGKLMESSLLHHVFDPSLVGDVMVFVPDDATGKQILMLLSAGNSAAQSSRAAVFDRFFFVSRAEEDSSQGTLLNNVNAAMSHAHESNPNSKRILLISTQICGPGADFCNVNTVIIFRFSFSIMCALQSGGRCGRNGKTGKVILICDPTAKDPMKDILWKDRCLRQSLSIHFDGISIAANYNCNNCTFCLKEDFYFSADSLPAKNDYSKREMIAEAHAYDYDQTPVSKKGKTQSDDGILALDNVEDYSNLTDSEILRLALPFFGSPKITFPITIRFAKFILRLKDQCLFAGCNQKHSSFGECSLLPKKLCYGCGFTIEQSSSTNGKWCINFGKCSLYSPKRTKGAYICYSCFTHCTLEKNVCSKNTSSSPRILFRLVLYLCHLGNIDFASRWKQIYDCIKDNDRFQLFQTLFNEANAKCRGQLRVSLWD